MALSCLAPQALASDWSIFTEFDSLTYSDSFSIYGLAEGAEKSDLTPNGEASYTHNQWTIGARKKNWEFGLFTRYDYLADYTADVPLLIHAAESDIEVPNGDYEIDTRLNHSRSSGFRLGYTHNVTPSLTTTFRLSGLSATQIIDGTLKGDLSFADTEISEGTLEVDYRFTEDLLFERDVEKKRAYGLSLDGQINWQASETLKLEFSAKDVFSRIWWDELPETIADATTAISRTAQNGVLIVRPRLQGRNLSDNYTQKLRARYNLSGTYDVSERWRLSQDIFKTSDNYLAETGVIYNLSPEAYIGANLEWVAGAPGLMLGWKDLRFEIAADKLSWKKAQYLKVAIGLSHTF